MNRTVIGAAAAIGALVAGAPASAHHSGAMFDHEKEVTIQGTVKEFQFTTPHSWIQVNVPDSGKVVEWSIESATPSALMRAGIYKNSLKPGDKVTVKAHPMKDGRPGGALVNIVNADGSVLDPRTKLAGAG